MTLPLIHALSKSSNSEKRRIVNIVKNHNTDDKKVKEVIAFVKISGGIEYAAQKMNEYKEKAFVLLNEFPDSNYKTSLRELVQFTTERNH